MRYRRVRYTSTLAEELAASGRILSVPEYILVSGKNGGHDFTIKLVIYTGEIPGISDDKGYVTTMSRNCKSKRVAREDAAKEMYRFFASTGYIRKRLFLFPGGKYTHNFIVCNNARIIKDFLTKCRVMDNFKIYFITEYAEWATETLEQYKDVEIVSINKDIPPLCHTFVIYNGVWLTIKRLIKDTSMEHATILSGRNKVMSAIIFRGIEKGVTYGQWDCARCKLEVAETFDDLLKDANESTTYNYVDGECDSFGTLK